MTGKKKVVKKAVKKSNKPKVQELTRDEIIIDLARLELKPVGQASNTIEEYISLGRTKAETWHFIRPLMEQIRDVDKGDLTQGYEMLTAQAHTLDTLFNFYAQKAIQSKHMPHLEKYMKLSLRAQSQCRSSWEAISVIQNPPIAYSVKQANVAHGPQQVNNAAETPVVATRTTKNKKSKSKLLLEKNNGTALDPRTTSTSGEADPQLATVVKIDRPQDEGGEN